MKQNVQQALAALGRMTPAELRAKYLEVFGDPNELAQALIRRGGSTSVRLSTPFARLLRWPVDSTANLGIGWRPGHLPVMVPLGTWVCPYRHFFISRHHISRRSFGDSFLSHDGRARLRNESAA